MRRCMLVIDNIIYEEDTWWKEKRVPSIHPLEIGLTTAEEYGKTVGMPIDLSEILFSEVEFAIMKSTARCS